MGALFGGAPKQDTTLLKRQEADLDAQKQKEELRRATETSEVEKRKALISRGGTGRSLLVKTSTTGVPEAAKNLGATG
jgi:hypothetical protein